MSISFTIETLAFLEVLKVQFPYNHLYHRIFLFVSSSPTCHVFLWTFQTSYTHTYSHSKKYPSRVSTKYSTPTQNFIFQLQVIKWKFQLWLWYLLCWVRNYLICCVILPGGLLRIIMTYFSLLTLQFFSRNISTYVAICTILLVQIGTIKSKNTTHCHDSTVEVLTVLLLKNQVLWDKTLWY